MKTSTLNLRWIEHNEIKFMSPLINLTEQSELNSQLQEKS